MGKIKTVKMGDLEAEETAREKAEEKREQKKLASSKAPADKEEKKKVVKKITVQRKYSFDHGKKYTSAVAKVDKNKTYSLPEAIKLIKETSYSKFDGTAELHINVTEKGLRGRVTLPHGTGRQVRVRIADDSLVADLEKGGKIDFDILVSDPSMMPKLAKIAKILGPKGLMPNPKTGTIGDKAEELALSLSKSVQWKTEPEFPIVHTILGKVSFDSKQLEENYQALTASIGKDRIKSAFIKATMGPAIRVLLS